MTHEIPFIFWPLLFIQILLFYKKSAGPAVREAEKNLNSRSSPRAALSRATRSRQEETNGETDFVHHFLGETSDFTGDYRIIRTSSY